MAKTPAGANLLLKAIEVLEAVGHADVPPRLTDVVKKTGLPTGTAHRILETLAAQRFLRRDETSRAYRLGSRLLQLARGAWEDFDIRAAALPELDRLQAELGQTILLSVLADDALVVIERRQAKDALRGGFGIGSSLALHSTAAGKAVLSSLGPESWRGTALSPATPRTITDPVALAAHLELAASNHFALDDEESALGLRGCAAPIRDQQGRPLGALSFSGPAEILTVARCREVGPLLAAAAERISWNLGFNPPERWSALAVGRGAEGLERVGTAIAFVGTNPLWSARHQGLFWSDRTQPAIRFHGLDGSERILPLPAGGAQGVMADGDLLTLVLLDGIHTLDPATGVLKRLDGLMRSGADASYVTANADALGRLWVATMDPLLSRATGRLYRVDRDRSVHCLVEGLLFPMGIAWSPENDRIYFSDGSRHEIYEADFDLASGTLGARRVFARIPEGTGRPTGLAVDQEGFLWNTQSEGWRVTRYSPEGQVDRVLHLPVSRPLDCGFGGEDLRTLYITSARLGVPERRLAEVPLSGAVLSYRTSVPGLPKHPVRIGAE
jgi:DNA-binding IclR family transcriptional regulator/sugar lactone lactonase YvrE